ncbi:MAG: M28 family peptidase [Lachnospiraceae bacterium]|nr:M28 family peptidase [Lachnospiraceae bacterium]
MSYYKDKIEGLENEIVAKVDGKKLMEYTREVAKWVRISGTQDEVDSLKYCQGVLDEMGYKTKLSFFPSFISVPVRACVEMISPQNVSFKALTHSFTPSTPVVGTEGEIVEYSFPAHYGKIVLAEGLVNADQVKALEKEGALGVIYTQDNYLHNSPCSKIWGNPDSETEKLFVNIPVASVNREDGEVIRQSIRKGRTVIRFETVVDTGFKDIPVLEADLVLDNTDKFLLFSSHIDSWDYGAMDNGSANATVIECARLIAEQKEHLQRGLRLVFWAGHSQGKFCGSAWYADNHFEELEEKCVGHVYSDSTGGKDAVIIVEAPVMPQTKQLAYDVIKKQTGQDFFGKRIGHFADQSFYGVGLTSIFGTFSEQDIEKTRDILAFRPSPTKLSGGLGWWWHTEHDTVDKVDEEFLVRDTKIYLAVIWRILTSAVLPYDMIAAVEEMQETVASLQAGLKDRFDLSAMTERLVALRSKTEELYEKIRLIDEPCKAADELNETIQALSRAIVRITFHGNNHYDFDLSGAMFPLQSLVDGKRLAVCPEGSYRYHVLKTQFRRGYNRVMSHLKEALTIVSE